MGKRLQIQWALQAGDDQQRNTRAVMVWKTFPRRRFKWRKKRGFDSVKSTSIHFAERVAGGVGGGGQGKGRGGGEKLAGRWRRK